MARCLAWAAQSKALMSSHSPSGSESPKGSAAGPAPGGPCLKFEKCRIPRWQVIAICVFITALTWAVFGQTLHFDFINYDDPTYVYKNPHLNHGLDWHEIAWVFTHENFHEWFPVTYVSRMIDSQLYGLDASGHHLTNVLLHIATALVLFLVLTEMTRAPWRSAFVASIFAIHPLRVESVAWVVERKDVLSGLFFMLTLWAWVRYINHRTAASGDTERRRWIYPYILALVFFTLGLLSKSMIVTLPFLLLLLDYWPLNRFPAGGWPAICSDQKSWRLLIIEKLPFIPLSIAACVATMITQKNVVLTAQHSGFFWRFGNVLLAYTDYLKHLVYPVGLALVYPHSNTNPPVVTAVLAGLLLAAITLVALATRRTRPYLLVGWLWYLGMFLPIIDSMQATQNARADRYTYLPHIGLYLMIAWGVVGVSNSWRFRKYILHGTATAVLAALAVDAFIQTSYWKNSVTIWTRTLACTSNNAFAENTLASALANEERWSEAIPHFEHSLQLDPGHVETHVNYGITLNNLGRRDEAIQQFQRALELNPGAADANYNLAGVLADEGKAEQAIPYLERALQLNPAYTEAHYDLGMAFATLEKWDAAIPQYEQALHQQLALPDAQYITAIALAAHGKPDRAIGLFQRVLQARPDFAQAHYRLGMALAARGDPAGASEHFQKALTLATAQGDVALAASIRAQLGSQAP